MSRIGNWFKRAGRGASGQIKRTTRQVAQPLTKAAPYIATGVTGVLSVFFTPAVGAAAGALMSANARNLGAVAARGRGLSGQEARHQGVILRKKVGIAAAIGTALGTTTALVAGVGFAAPAATAIPAGNAAAIGAGGSASGIGANAALASAPVNALAPAGGWLPGATQGAFAALPQGGSAAVVAAQEAAVAAGATSAGGGGLLGFLGDLGLAALPVAGNVLTQIMTPVKEGAQPLLDLAGSMFGGAGQGDAVPGTGDTSAGAGGDGMMSSPVKIAALAGGAALLGWIGYKLVTRKAA